MTNKRKKEATKAPAEEEWDKHRNVFREYFTRQSFFGKETESGKTVKHIPTLLQYMEREYNFVLRKYASVICGANRC
jgi:hypothetical protein